MRTPRTLRHPFGSPVPSAIDPRGCSTYQLLVDVPRALRLRIGALGWCDVPAGHYVYTGSAKRNLAARLRRHLRRDKRRHWHIDYLLSAGGVTVVGIRVSALAECPANQLLTGVIEIPRFGASDCRAGCASHLKRVDQSESDAEWIHVAPLCEESKPHR